MNIRSERLARILSRILLVLLIVCAIGLVVLIPTMVFAYLAPGALPDGLQTRANGVPVDIRQPLVAGTLLLYANVILAASAAIVVKLRQIMTTVAAGNPFDVRNVTRLRLIAYVMAGVVVFEALGGLVAPNAVHTALNMPKGGGFNFGMFIGTLVVLVLAEVFREGARLREDAEMTV